MKKIIQKVWEFFGKKVNADSINLPMVIAISVALAVFGFVIYLLKDIIGIAIVIMFLLVIANLDNISDYFKIKLEEKKKQQAEAAAFQEYIKEIVVNELWKLLHDSSELCKYYGIIPIKMISDIYFEGSNRKNPPYYRCALLFSGNRKKYDEMKKNLNLRYRAIKDQAKQSLQNPLIYIENVEDDPISKDRIRLEISLIPDAPAWDNKCKSEYNIEPGVSVYEMCSHNDIDYGKGAIGGSGGFKQLLISEDAELLNDTDTIPKEDIHYERD